MLKRICEGSSVVLWRPALRHDIHMASLSYIANRLAGWLAKQALALFSFLVLECVHTQGVLTCKRIEELVYWWALSSLFSAGANVRLAEPSDKRESS